MKFWKPMLFSSILIIVMLLVRLAAVLMLDYSMARFLQGSILSIGVFGLLIIILYGGFKVTEIIYAKYYMEIVILSKWGTIILLSCAALLLFINNLTTEHLWGLYVCIGLSPAIMIGIGISQQM